MTLFRNYYHKANDDIKADEEFKNRVIDSVHNYKTPKRKPVYKRYAVNAAAAVILVSAAAVCLPFLNNDEPDSGIIETANETCVPESTPDIIANTATPQSVPQSTPNAVQSNDNETATSDIKDNTDYNNSQQKIIPEEKKENTSTHSYNYYSSSENNSSVKAEDENLSVMEENEEKAVDNKNEVIEQTPLPMKAFAQFSNVLGSSENKAESSMENNAENSNTALTAKVAEESVKSESDYMAKADISCDASTDSKMSEEQMYSAAGGSAKSSVDISPPDGYYTSSNTEGAVTFSSDSGSEIYIDYYYSGEDDTEPSYYENEDCISAQVTKNGTSYSVTAYGADTEIVEEVVSNL